MREVFTTKVRIKFTKHRAIESIEHLDVIRYFQKAMRRTGADIKYSRGFNPHQITSFATPLGVGLTSNGEYMNIEVSSMGDSKTMMHQLNGVMAEGIEMLSCHRLEDTAKSAMSMVAAINYTMRFRDGARPDDMDAFLEELISFYGRKSIVITKRTKRGKREVDLKPLIYDLHQEDDAIFLQPSTGSSDNIKPELVLEASYSGKGQTFSRLNIQIQREKVYGNTEGEEHRVLTPLEDFGKDIE